jgi:arginyl-tRNA synthetase
MLPHKIIEERLQNAVKSALPDTDTLSILVRPCPDPKFGDYQSNALMSLAKARKMNPRQLATDVVGKLNVADLCEPVEIAGAGFLNFRLKAETVAEALQSAARGEHLFFEISSVPQTVVVDFSSPNVAKPMHVGHIRSTILGDSLARVLRLLGHKVVTDNHIGDWGTQFGMLIVAWKRRMAATGKEPTQVDEVVELYKNIQTVIGDETRKALEKAYPEKFKELRQQDVADADIVKKIINELGADKPMDLSPTEVESRQQLVKLQAGDSENLSIWKKLLALSQVEFDSVYGRLGISFDHTLGESFYNPRLKAVVEELLSNRVAAESRGAKAILSDSSTSPKDDPFLIHKEGNWVANPFIIRKQDGAFNYATTDLATLAHRLETWHPNEIIYVTDGRQQLHFQQLFATFRRWHPEAKVKLAHVWFGSILGEDGKPYKTREGKVVKLADLLDEAEERAFKVVTEKNNESPQAECLQEVQRREIARVVGLGAIKYADLLPNRQSDYVFSWDKMLALHGNTAPYLQYAYARIRSIFRKGNLDTARRDARPTGEGRAIILGAPQELALAKHLLNFGLILEAVADEYRPNFLCNYLYELAGHFTAFYENCPVLKSEPEIRASRLLLCDLTARVLQQGLAVLGIETLEQM